MNTSLRYVSWALGLLAATSGAGCGDKPPRNGTDPVGVPRDASQPDATRPDAGDGGGDPVPTCLAAQGLAADKRLICVDFTSALPAADSGWTFPAECGGPNWKWTVTGGALSLSSFADFGDGTAKSDKECSFTSRRVNKNELEPYSAFTLSIVHRVDLRTYRQSPVEAANQSAQIRVIGGPADPLAQFTGRSTAPTFLRHSVTIQKADLGSDLQAQFNLVTTGIGGTGPAGWQIKSIAILGHR